jgi:hypothetical protein
MTLSRWVEIREFICAARCRRVCAIKSPPHLTIRNARRRRLGFHSCVAQNALRHGELNRMFRLKFSLLRRIPRGDDMPRTVPEPFRRGRCVAVGRRAVFSQRRGGSTPGIRIRSDFLMLLAAAWRRCAMGTNHISCFGLWRRGTRRQALRVNRQGDARWNHPARIVRHDFAIGNRSS